MSDAPHLLHVFPTFCAAGPQVRTTGLMAGLGNAFRHSVVACDGRTGAAELVPADIGLRLVEPPRVDGPLAGMRAMRRLVEGEQPDLLLTYNWGAMDAVLAARSLGLERHVHHEDGFNVDEAERLKARRNFTRRMTLRRTDVVVPSRTLERIARRRWRLPRVHFIPNGVDTAHFARDAAAGAAFRAALDIPEEALIVGTVGHLRPVKNFARLLRAASLVEAAAVGRPVHVVVAGDGAERQQLEAAAAAHPPPGGRVHFTGHLADLRGVYSALDVFCLSSDSEQQPVSLLEAMAAGCAVAATDVGDIAASLPAEARAQVVALGPGVEATLGAALTRLLADAALRDRLAQAGLEHARREFSLAAMLVAYERLWRAALAR